MATSQTNNTGFLDQLREMRATRTQQLRQAGQQAALLNRQINALTNLNRTMEAVLNSQKLSNNSLKQINTNQSNLYKQGEQLNRSISNLATTMTRSIGGLANTIGRGAGSAVVGAGGAVVSAASSVASGISSALLKTLPFAIAGVIGKTMVWDNLDDGVKKQVTEAFGGLLSSVMGDIDTSKIKKVFEPVTKEIDIVFGALGDTFKGLVKKFESIPTSMEESAKSIKKAVEVIKNTFEDLSIGFEKFKVKLEALERTVSGIPQAGENTINTVAAVGAAVGAKKIYDVAKAAPGAAVAGQAAAAGTEATVATTATRLKTTTSGKVMSDKELKLIQETFDNMKKFGLKKDIFGLLGGRLITLLGGASGAFARAVIKYKLTSTIALVSLALKFVELSFIINEIDVMTENGYITNDEAEWLKGYISTESFAGIAGGFVVGTLGAVAGVATGPFAPIATPVIGAAGAIGGQGAGEDIGRFAYKVFKPMPKSLERTFENEEANVNKLLDERVRSSRKNGGNQSTESSISSESRPSAAVTGDGDYQPSQYLIDFIKRKEGFRETAYKDEKQYSIGYGTKARDEKEGPITKQEAEKRLIEELTRSKKTVTEYNYKNQRNWNSSQIEALSSFIYNLGPGALDQVTANNKRSNDEIAEYMLKYINAGGKPNEGLIKRRRMEVAMFGGKNNPRTSPSYEDDNSLSFAQNLERRRRESQAEEEQQAKYTEGSKSFVGPSMPAASQFALSDLFSGKSSIDAGTFFNNFDDIVRGIEDKLSTQPPVNVVYQDNSVSNAVSGGGGGSAPNISTSSVISRPYDKSWQFNSLAGGNPLA